MRSYLSEMRAPTAEHFEASKLHDKEIPDLHPMLHPKDRKLGILVSHKEFIDQVSIVHKNEISSSARGCEFPQQTSNLY